MLNIFSLKKGAILKIVYGCNHKCIFCHERDNIFSMNFKNISVLDLDDIFVWIRKNNFDYVIISGGEPTIHPKFIDIIKYFQEKGIYIIVVTNGTYLLNHDLEKIDRNKITFYISYHGLKENYNKITGSNDFMKVTNNIKKLEKLFPEIILRYVINNKNEKYFIEFNKFVFNTFPKIYLEYVLVEDLEHAHVQKTTITLKEYYSLIFKFIRNDRILIDGGVACINRYMFNNARGKFDPLVNTMLGLVKKDKKGEMIYNIKENISPNNIKSKWKKCNSCVQYDYCHGFDLNYL